MAEDSPLKGAGILTPLQKQFLKIFATLPDQSQFYLAGGTALSEYYLGHRLSYDLDLFTGTDGLVQPASFQIEKACTEHNLPIKVIRRFATFVEFLAGDEQNGLKIDLALDSPFRFEPSRVSEIGIQVNDYKDLRTDKLLAYFGRSEPRDAVDLFFIIQNEPVEPLLEQAKEKDPGFDLYWFAVALNLCENFPDEIERWPVKMLKPFEPPVLKRTFLDWAMKLMDGNIKK